MNKKIYAILLILLFALRASAMEEMIAYNQGLVVAEEKASETNIMAIQIPKAKNEKGGLNKDEVDLLLSLEPFKKLIEAKHEKNDSYLLARTLEQTEDGSVVNYFDAHALNHTLFGAYLFEDLRELSKYNHPITKNPLQWLEYYECIPDTKVFTFMCTYAALCSKNESKRNFYRHKFYVNQENDLQLVANAKHFLGFAYHNGEGVAADPAKAVQLFKEVAQQKDNLEAAASAKLDWGIMLWCGEGVAADPVSAIELYKEVAQQKDNLEAAARAKLCWGFLFQHGEGVAADPAKAMRLFEEVAQQEDDLGVAAIAKNNLEVMKASGCIDTK